MKKLRSITLSCLLITFMGHFYSCFGNLNGGWECNGMNPEGFNMVPRFDDTTLIFSDTLGNSLVFNVADTLYFDHDCPREIYWQLDEAGGNMRIFLALYAPLPQSYQNDSAFRLTVSLDTDLSNSNEGFMHVDFDPDRLDTCTVSYTTYSHHKYEVIPSFTTPYQTYTHVYVCTDIDATPEPGITPDRFYFHKGTGFIGFHDITSNKNWYLQP